MEFNTVEVDAEGAVGHLTLNRPEALNALSLELLRELAEAARWFDERPEVLVVVVSGAGRAFSAGADLRDPSRSPGADAELSWVERRESAYLGSRMAQAVESMRAVTVARLHGYVIGGGVVLATACDFRFAAEDTVFYIPEVDLGVPLSWGGIPRLVRDIGAIRTKELVMSCRRFDAKEALDIGLVNEVLAGDDLDERVETFAAELARKPAVPLLQTKAQVNAAANALAVTAFADGDLIGAARSQPESQQAALEFAQRALKKNDGE